MKGTGSGVLFGLGEEGGFHFTGQFRWFIPLCARDGGERLMPRMKHGEALSQRKSRVIDPALASRWKSKRGVARAGGLENKHLPPATSTPSCPSGVLY